MKLQPGVEVTPNVRLEAHLAKGAMGAVWIAEHLTLNTKVAVKFISEDRLDPNDPEVLERFVREASAAAQIKSNHVVQTFDQGVMRDGTPYIVMELLEGEELGERLQREKTLSLREVVKIVGQTAKALQAGHKLGIVHRDIKPDNIFLSVVDDELMVKVFDFGIAKIRHHVGDSDVDVTAQLGERAQMGLTNDGVMLGTPEYMSPEAVLNASAVDHHADLWGLAVVAYVSLTGELPFKGHDVGELCVSLLEADFELPSKLRPEISAEIDAWFEKALARNVEDRYQTAREMAQALAQAMPSGAAAGDLMTSGAWEARGSSPSVAKAAVAKVDSERGLRGDSFSGAAADADSMGRRLSPSTIGGAVAAALAAAIVLFMLVGGGDAETSAPSHAASAVAPPVPPTPVTTAAVTTTTTAERAETQAPSASASSAPPASAAPKPVYRPPVKPRPRNGPQPKDPGF